MGGECFETDLLCAAGGHCETIDEDSNKTFCVCQEDIAVPGLISLTALSMCSAKTLRISCDFASENRLRLWE